MKKFLVVTMASIIIVAGVGLAGCGSGKNNANSQANAGGAGMMGFQRPDVYGEITEIAGNEITLKEIKLPQMGRYGRYTPDPNRTPSPGMRVRMTGRPDGSAGGYSYGNGSGGASGNSPYMGQGGNGSGRQAPKVEYTGKTVDIVIPVGVKVTQITMGQDRKPTTEEVAITSLKKGDTLSVIYAADGKTVARVMLSNGMRGGGGRFFGGGGAGGSGGYGGGNGSGGGDSGSGSDSGNGA